MGAPATSATIERPGPFAEGESDPEDIKRNENAARAGRRATIELAGDGGERWPGGTGNERQPGGLFAEGESEWKWGAKRERRPARATIDSLLWEGSKGSVPPAAIHPAQARERKNALSVLGALRKRPAEPEEL